MTVKRAFVYIDDNEEIIKAFKKTVNNEWNIRAEVLSNTRFGNINNEEYDDFEKEVCDLIQNNIDIIECIFLDLDFSGSVITDDEMPPDLMGITLGRKIRKSWSQMPIIISTRFTEKEIIKKGLKFDFDNIYDGITLIHMALEEFEGMLMLAKQKRSNLIESFGDVPISFKIGRNKYFRRSIESVINEDYVFVAMPFDESIVNKDVWELGIKGAMSELDLHVTRVDIDKRSTPIMEKIATLAFECTFCIVDLTGWNANVLYELGLVHTANKDCIMICQGDDEFELPFDVKHMKVIKYNSGDISTLKEELIDAVKQLSN